MPGRVCRYPSVMPHSQLRAVSAIGPYARPAVTSRHRLMADPELSDRIKSQDYLTTVRPSSSRSSRSAGRKDPRPRMRSHARPCGGDGPSQPEPVIPPTRCWLPFTARHRCHRSQARHRPRDQLRSRLTARKRSRDMPLPTAHPRHLCRDPKPKPYSTRLLMFWLVLGSPCGNLTMR
jgi:hypothetical protein